MKTLNYINLTNGIEFLENNFNQNLRFIRLQSTACEQKRWDFILQELDYDFLLNLALGNTVIVVDYSAKKDCSRATWQGLEWIKFVLNKYWLDKEYNTCIRNQRNCNPYFEECYKKLDSRTIKKLEHIKHFLNADEIHLKSICKNTANDNNWEYYKGTLVEWNGRI